LKLTDAGNDCEKKCNSVEIEWNCIRNTVTGQSELPPRHILLQVPNPLAHLGTGGESLPTIVTLGFISLVSGHEPSADSSVRSDSPPKDTIAAKEDKPEVLVTAWAAWLSEAEKPSECTPAESRKIDPKWDVEPFGIDQNKLLDRRTALTYDVGSGAFDQ
jgi:hypothetical protein